MHWERMWGFLLQEYYSEYQDKSQDFRAKKKVSSSEIIVSRFEN